jgi:hypothetical protein
MDVIQAPTGTEIRENDRPCRRSTWCRR